jgi:cytochrome c peroxidase
MLRSLLVVAVASTFIAGCHGAGNPPPDDDAGLTRREVIGKRLFFDTSLSEPAGQSCSTCHDPAHAFSGNNGSAAGVPLGADGRSLGIRNTPSVMYARFSPAFARVDSGEGPAPVGGQFVDGRAASLEEQAAVPLFDADEMNNASPRALVAKVAAARYAGLMRAEWGASVFDDPNTAMTAMQASIAAFERTERFAPFSSKYDHVIAGDARFTADEARGLDVFMDPEKGNCAACHAADPRSSNPKDSLFTDFSYDNLGVPRNPRIPANRDPAFFDLGLCGPKRTAPDGDTSVCGAFKVPTLRNVARRQAYMHNGYFTGLRDVVAFYATRDTDPSRWYADGVPFDDLPPQWRANVNVDEVPYDRKPGESPRLSDADVDAIVAFLYTLDDGYGASLASRAK